MAAEREPGTCREESLETAAGSACPDDLAIARMLGTFSGLLDKIRLEDLDPESDDWDRKLADWIRTDERLRVRIQGIVNQQRKDRIDEG